MTHRARLATLVSVLAGGACLLFFSACGAGIGGVAPLEAGVEASTREASDDGGDGGTDARITPTEPLTVFGTYAIQRFFLGETDRSGAVTKDAWKIYGENLDGLVSTAAAPGANHCIRFAGADSAKVNDGNDGIDNAFGRTVLAFLLGLVPTPSKTMNDGIAGGSSTLAIALLPPSGSNGARAGIFTLAETTPATPRFDGTDVRAASPATVNGGPDEPRSIAPDPRMAGRLVATGILSGTVDIDLPVQGVAWRIPLRSARITMTISADGTNVVNGTIAGIAPREELVTAFEKVAGRISSQLCSGSTLDTIKTTIRQASDILADGTQSASKECDGISVGIGFEAVKVTATGTKADPPPPPDPCTTP